MNTCKYHPEIVADNLIGLVIKCPVCDTEITLGEVHPPVEQKAKRHFRYRKDLEEGLASGKSVFDKAGWVEDWVFDAPVRAKLDWYHRESNADLLEGVDTPNSINNQRVILRTGRTKYNCLIYDIDRSDEDVVVGYYMNRRFEIKVEQVGDGVWWEVDREKREHIEWVACSMCGKYISKAWSDLHYDMCFDCERDNGE